MQKLKETISKIEKLDVSLMEETQRRLDNLTKPRGSLGRLEEIAKQVVGITKKRNPSFKNKVIFVMAADHGVTEEGVSAYPKEVTSQMVYNFIKGGAAINVLAKHVGARVLVVDMGVDGKLEIESPNFKDRKINYGTKNMAKEPAMTKEEAIRAIEAGIEVFEEELSKGMDIVATGDMGIGNTTSSSAIASCLTGISVKDLTGRGTGISDEVLLRKIEVSMIRTAFKNWGREENKKLLKANNEPINKPTKGKYKRELPKSFSSMDLILTGNMVKNCKAIKKPFISQFFLRLLPPQMLPSGLKF